MVRGAAESCCASAGGENGRGARGPVSWLVFEALVAVAVDDVGRLDWFGAIHFLAAGLAAALAGDWLRAAAEAGLESLRVGFQVAAKSSLEVAAELCAQAATGQQASAASNAIRESATVPVRVIGRSFGGSGTQTVRPHRLRSRDENAQPPA